VIIELPIPPSLNNAFVEFKRNGKTARVKSAEYGRWQADAIKQLQVYAVAPLVRPYAVHIRVNIDHKSDVDNRVKPVLDALVKAGVICGDQWVDDCRITRDRSVQGCEVELWSIAGGGE
jgi:Holliday junction resolvase RusA-like endonuclease